ncbi:helix-turn-helix domain-containing protein [Paenisporosarcina antarctica]|uniref:XRE family transcriptional regulator n=1 Tax=Paenisporosarcina antarctica TaxID=417367 RepID=A0A4P6ZU95_9BACL|nr:helix-turn-helix transcriptional regulator [Paenisporosarcina antarctica]QBP39891.1 XRE family transcriptional regulator [Paenisporosarcina antarctica]
MLNKPCIGFGKFIKESREFKNLSLEMFADQLKVSHQIVDRLEMDLLHPSGSLIKKLSLVLNVEENELFNLIWCENPVKLHQNHF